MMIVRGVTQVKAEMESLVDAVERGEEVVITRWGKPIAKMIKHQPRKLGAMEGKIIFSPDYDQADAEIESLFYEPQDIQAPLLPPQPG